MNGGPLTVESLFSPFPGPDAVMDYEVVPGDGVPEPYRKLLVHEHHMTVTVEAHHGGPVDVVVLERWFSGALYSRKILLELQGTRKVVQFGIVRIDLAQTSPQVREAIVAGRTPLGRVLIEHDVLRRIEPLAYLKIRPSAEQLAWFGEGVPAAPLIWGRLAIIHCDGRPAVELLEVVAPE
jgi:chorismate-pyruvate lyase